MRHIAHHFSALTLAIALAACGTTTNGGGGTFFPDVHGDGAAVADSGQAGGQDVAGAGQDVATGDVAVADAPGPVDITQPKDADGAKDADSAKDIASTQDTGSSKDTGSTTGTPLTWDVGQGDGCVVLATATCSVSNTCSTGDFLLLAGANVDLMSASQSSPAFCPQGSPATVSDIPSDYSTCAWTDYVEGMGGLDGTGYIVRDRNGAHHWKLRIDHDQGSVFEATLLAID